MTDFSDSFDTPDGPAITVDPVAETPRSSRGRLFVRLAAVVVALGLAGGGAVLAINAGSASGGADNPEAAVSRFLASLSNEDVLGAAEVVEPSERATLVDSGVTISEELVRLNVLSPEFDLSALNGIDLRFDNVQLRAVPVSNNVTQVFIDGGSSRASVDASKLPLGPVIAEHIPPDWLTFSDSVATPIQSSVPIAVVNRSGRWYVSLWYTVAENARISAGKPMPSVADRPVPIGADSPEAAVERLMREVLRLDPRTVIGMLDPEEMAALYDYAPLFLPEAEAAANDALQAAADSGFEWSIDSISLSSIPDGDLASVSLDAIEASLTSPDVNGHLKLADGKVDVDVKATLPDYMGNPTTTTYSFHDGCLAVESDNPDMGPGFNSCDDQSGIGMFGGGLFSLPTQAVTSTNTADFGVITHKVDGKWFVSPIRTVTTAIITSLKATNPDDLAAAVDSVSQLFSGQFAGSESVSTFGSAEGQGFAPATPMPSIPAATVADFDLKNAYLPSDMLVITAFDLSPEEAIGVLEVTPSLAALGLDRSDIVGGATAILSTGTNGSPPPSLAVVELTDEARDRVAALVDDNGGEIVDSTDFGLTNLVVLHGNRFIAAGGFDTGVDMLRGMVDSVR